MFLTGDDLKELTGKIQKAAQVRVLRAMGVQHKVRPDGSPAVLLEHIYKLLDAGNRSHVKAPIQPNWDGVR